MDKLSTFQDNDSLRLYELSKKLNTTKFFKRFLSDSQYRILNYLINLNSVKVWDNFLEGNCYLIVSDKKESNANEDKNGSNKESNDDTNKDEGKSIPTDEEDQDMDIEQGIKSIKGLALHIRYLLWEKAVDFYFSSKDLDQSINTIDEVNDDYELIDSLDKVKVPGSSEDNVQPTKPPVREEEDDYDDDEDDEDNVQAKNNDHTTQDKSDDIDVTFNDENQLILEIPRSIFTKTEEDESTIEDQENLIKEFNKVYHNFEYDRETLIKRRKLEKSDLKLEKTSEIPDEAKNNTSSETNVEFAFATGSSLKHLFSTIQQHRDQIPLNDYELRTLFMDVKKNRGKWANDERVGQEELYDACEKVVLELRSYTEHSTPFLNKVSKREAPNYGLIIKKPMDLNTVMKKLKNLQYNSKQEFVDDIMLIWSNCLTYNSDPRHFLRAHAIAMQKKSLKLIPHIPNIVIRNRSEVEKEEEQENVNNESNKGKSSKKGRKRTRDNQVKIENESSVNSPESNFETPIDLENDKPMDTPDDGTPIPVGTEGSPGASERAVPVEPNAPLGPTTSVQEEEEEEEDNDEINENNDEDEEDEIGPELVAWRNLTAKSRAHYCDQRAKLFQENNSYHLNFDAPAIIREPNEMNNFSDYISNNQFISKSNNLLENDEPYLLEYDITGGLPGMQYKGIDDNQQEMKEQKIVDEYLNNRVDQKNSDFWLSTEEGLNKAYFKNISEMQEIRRICFKISLIRQMQTQQFVHHTQMRQPEVNLLKEVDVDPVSKLSNHEPFNQEIQYSVLRRNVSKIAMQTGFESTEPFAINTLTQMAEKYMGNLAKSIKTLLESQSRNRLSTREIVLVSLIENGVNKPDDLYTFVNEKILNQLDKLKDLRTKLSKFLKELLRPGLENFNEKSFSDNSEQFITGDFSNDLGDDFFGFKELGLDKEFNLLSSSIPIYLLHSKLHNSYSSTGTASKQNKFDDLKEYKVNRLYAADVDNQIGLLKPFYQKLLDKSKNQFIKQQKKKGESANLPDASKFPLLDDDDLPQKQRNIRPRLPPTGKIGSTKKRIIANSYILPEWEEESHHHEQNPLQLELQLELQSQQHQQQHSENDFKVPDSNFDSEQFDTNSNNLDINSGNDHYMDNSQDQDQLHNYNEIDTKEIELMMNDLDG